MTESTTLYRKYRPRKFAEAVGQEETVDELKHYLRHWDDPTVSKPHAMIFRGPRGCGKTTLARIFAASLNCENQSEDCEPCGECNTCRGVIDGTSTVGLEEIDAAQKSGVGDMQDLIQSLQIASMAKVKVILIDEVHLLTPQGQSKLLKTLEEPPPNVLFIFATTDPDKLKDSTLSRLAKINIRLMGPDVIETLIRRVVAAENREISDENLAGIVALADGSARESLSRLESVLAGRNITIGKWAHRVTAAIGKNNVSEVLITLSEALNGGEDLQSVTSEIIAHWRNCMYAQMAPQLIQRLPRVMLEAAQADAALIKTPKLLRLMDSVIEARGKMHQTSDSMLLVQSALVQVLVPEANNGIDGVQAKLDLIEDRLMGRLDAMEEKVSTLLAAAPVRTAAPVPSTVTIPSETSTPWPGVDAPRIPAQEADLAVQEAVQVVQESRQQIEEELSQVGDLLNSESDAAAEIDLEELRSWLVDRSSRRVQSRLQDDRTRFILEGSTLVIEVTDDSVPEKVKNELEGSLSLRRLALKMRSA